MKKSKERKRRFTSSVVSVEIRSTADHHHPVPQGMKEMLERFLKEAGLPPRNYPVYHGRAVKGSQHIKDRGVWTKPGLVNGVKVTLCAQPGNNRTARLLHISFNKNEAGKYHEMLRKANARHDDEAVA